MSNIVAAGHGSCPDHTGKWKHTENGRGTIIGLMEKGIAIAVVAGMLIWYCAHPAYYGDDGNKTLLSSSRTWFMILASTCLLVLYLTPNRLSDRRNRIAGWIWFALSPFAVYFSLLYLNARKFKIKFTELNHIAVGFTFWFLFLVLLAFLVITGSIRASVIFLAVAVAVLGIANRFVISFRGTAISGADLFSLKTAVSVASGYTYKTDWYIFSEVFLTAAICGISLKIRKFRPFHWKRRMVLLAVWLLAAGLFYHICCQTSFLEDHDIRSGGFTHQLRYKQYDMLFTTLCTCFYLAADKPDGYSLQRVQEIAQDYIGTEQTSETGNAAGAGLASVQTPNLIVIMDESLADYTDIGNGLEYSEDYMPFMRSLTENTIKGTAYASIFGANTANSEYEFLTGNTMGFLPQTSVGFNLFVRGNMPSLASEAESVGYNTLAMHPYRGTNYRRNIVYPQIGFDQYYDRTSFSSPEYIRQYISDQSLFDRIIEEFEKNRDSGKPLFSYNVTVQNHGDYLKSNQENLDDSIYIKTPGVNETKTQQYANLIKATDDAFRNLITYFSAQEEPVVVVIFGDHQPNLGEATYSWLIGDEDKLTSEELMEKYKVPFIVWANYDIEEETIEKTSLNYLYSILADRLNLPMTGYQKYLLDLSEEIPVLAAGGYWTADGDFYELNDRISPYYDRINEYHILEYNYIFGKDNRCLELFTLDCDSEQAS